MTIVACKLTSGQRTHSAASIHVIRFCHAIVLWCGGDPLLQTTKEQQRIKGIISRWRLRPPLTRVSPSVCLRLSLSARFNFAFTGIRRGTNVALTATLRRRGGGRASSVGRLSLCPLEWVFISTILPISASLQNLRSSSRGVQLVSHFSAGIARRERKSS